MANRIGQKSGKVIGKTVTKSYSFFKSVGLGIKDEINKSEMKSDYTKAKTKVSKWFEDEESSN